MSQPKARPTLRGGLDRWCAGQAVLLGDVHRWITARERIDDRWQAVAVRHGGFAAGSVFLVGIGGWPVGAAGACWAVAAWRRAPEPQETVPTSEPTPPTRAEMRREAYLRLFCSIIGDRTGVHVSELYAVLRSFTHWCGAADEQLRALVDDIGVPVQRTMRVGKITGRSGIRLADVRALMTGIPIPSPPLFPSPSPQPEEAGHLPVERPVERGVENPVEPVVIVTVPREEEPSWPSYPQAADRHNRRSACETAEPVPF